ncbi:unnamed protein product [Blepharisma stoltei]|uniref:Odorant receptor n=1 Tax=Blepharisma stoltei TaxID=1481888 RepID=A0AAU9IHU1_9CILI|nr:unnamed protein product [Blepharisma stoltei]
MDEDIKSSLVSSESSDDSEEDSEIEEVKFPKEKVNFRRQGNVFVITDFRQTRADKIREVNMQLIPLVRSLFIYSYMFTACLWLLVFIYPTFFVVGCTGGHYEDAHVVCGIYLGCTFIFEYISARKVVKIIQPLSGHTKLTITQHIKLVTSVLGKLDIYTDFCFLSIANSCNSVLSPFSLIILCVLTAIMISLQVRSWFRQDILGFQMTEYNALYDLLGKYETMYLEGEKSQEHKRNWAKKTSILPAIKFFSEDIGQFVIQILFLIEMRTFNTLVCVSLSVSLSMSFLLLAFTYLKIHLFKPNLAKEQEFMHVVSVQIKENNLEETKKLLGGRVQFRKYEHETRAEVLKVAAAYSYDIFDYIVSTLIQKNDAILQSETFHMKMLTGLRQCKLYPDVLIRSLELLRLGKHIYINVNKRISISSEGTILHCLVEDPYFIVRTLKNKDIDLIKYVVLLGIDVNIPDKFGETPITLVARLNVGTLIRSCSTQTLKELFELNGISMEKEETDIAIKNWAFRVTQYLVGNGALLTHRNRKNKSVLEIAEDASNSELCNYLYEQFGLKNEFNRKSAI